MYKLILIFLEIENGKILDHDILVNNEKGDEAPPNQSKISNIFKNFNKIESESNRKNSLLHNQNSG